MTWSRVIYLCPGVPREDVELYASVRYCVSHNSEWAIREQPFEHSESNISRRRYHVTSRDVSLPLNFENDKTRSARNGDECCSLYLSNSSRRFHWNHYARGELKEKSRKETLANFVN